jgi:hypothetical protein
MSRNTPLYTQRDMLLLQSIAWQRGYCAALFDIQDKRGPTSDPYAPLIAELDQEMQIERPPA